MIVYISGPMRSKPGHNYLQFGEVEKALYNNYLNIFDSSLGKGDEFGVINPAKNFDGDTTRPASDYMRVDMQAVLESDALVLLPGWEDSEGAKLEVAVAKSIGLKFWKAVHGSNAADGDHAWWFERIEEPSENGKQSPREQSLRRAISYVTGDRNSSYGPPTQDFERTAKLWNAAGYRAPGGREFLGHDVAILMTLLKVSRLTWQWEKADSWDDASGYMACGFECAVSEAG